MKRISLKRVSILGIVLTTVAAITAAINPSNTKPDTGLYLNGTLTINEDNPKHETCKPPAGTGPFNCHNTVSGARQHANDTDKEGSIFN